MLANMNGEVNGTTDETREVSPIKEKDTKLSIQKETPEVENKSNSNEKHCLDSESVHSDDGVKKCSNNGELKNGLKNLEPENSENEPGEQLSKNGDQSTKATTESDKTGDQNTEKVPKNVNGEDKSDKKGIINDKIEKTDTIEKENIKEDSIESSENEKEDDIGTDPDDYPIGEGSDLEPHIEDTVSIDSDSGDSLQDGHDKSNDVIILENDESRDGSEVHEIESDNDCVVTEETNNATNKTLKKNVEPRRSSRTPKRVKYDDDYENETESDVELVSEDTLKRKSRPILIKDTKKLVEIASKQGNNLKKKTTVVIIDSPNKSSSLNANFYQSIVGRGTTVTAVTCKSSSTSTQAVQSAPAVAPASAPAPAPAPVPASAPAAVTASQAQTNILPSLTDDMFVVEAPSFIVPYVYEKPSMKPFREFVDKLGKELEEQKAKEEKEKLEKKKEEKAKRDKEKQEKRERGEEVQSSDEENVEASSQASQESQDLKKKKAEKKERRRRKKDDDDDSWDGSESDDTDDETISDEESNVIVLKEKLDAAEEIKHIVADPIATESAVKSDNYFDCSLGKFFTDIGINLVKEYVQTDLIKQQNRKLVREKKTGQNTRERLVTIAALMKNLELSKENNVPYKFTLKKCEFCSFKTESELVMANHLQIPHMKNNLYKCNFCSFQIKSPHDIIFHMEAEHNIKGKLERAPSCHECANCPFEDNGKGKLARHIIACAKKFKPDLNLSPPLEWEPPAKIPKLSKNKNSIVGPYSNSFGRANLGRPQVNPVNSVGIGGVVGAYRPRGRAPQIPQPRGLPISGAPVGRPGLAVRPTALNFGAKGKSVQHPSISITPLPRQPAPIPIHTLASQNSKGTFVICEICDGYIKDLEQLRNHMQWIHKVKIHPKMIYNRPPLNCQKCQFRFFTDQGLERHLLGSHGLVTSSMQEAANKGKDAGRCPVCGRVYQSKLLNHVSRDHNLTLKPAHLSYKCTVCTATFGMYKQFENHVYSAHSVVAKRVMDKNKPAAPPAKTTEATAKSLKINDEITITPQPATAPKPK